MVTDYVEREIERRQPGDVMRLTVLRGSDRLELKAALGDEPKLVREASRTYFEKLGFTAREFVYGDAIEQAGPERGPDRGRRPVPEAQQPLRPRRLAARRLDPGDRRGAGEDLYRGGVEALRHRVRCAARREFVLLVSRGGDTLILRVKLK